MCFPQQMKVSSSVWDLCFLLSFPNHIQISSLSGFCQYAYISTVNTMLMVWFPLMPQALWFPLLEAMMAPQKLSSSAAPHRHCEGKPIRINLTGHSPAHFCLQSLLWQSPSPVAFCCCPQWSHRCSLRSTVCISSGDLCRIYPENV